MKHIWILVSAGLASLAACAPPPQQSSQATAPSVAPASSAQTAPVNATDDLTYPVVFDDVQALREVGLTLGGGWGGGAAVQSLPNKCYYYGDGGYTMTISDELLAGFLAAGFTQRTACLGLISGIKYDPETGDRLPTIMLVDARSLQQWGFTGEPGQVTDEIPLALPGCFRRGLPVSDCALNFDFFTGQPIGARTRENLENRARLTIENVRALLASGSYTEECAATQRSYQDQCRVETYPNTPDNVYIAGHFATESITSSAGMNVVDISPVFEGGFAYAINADGAAGPSASLDSGKLALDPKKRASVSTIKSLKSKLPK